ncbi:MAG TPA: RNA polymerase sigma factor region1.1 domain-containing protein, partial [Desulfatiglandales bacterium]|nr:RNA polymerase sigma factor region1.1 domain-containing protein [Desulfatiglandales bacterium]
MAKNSDGINLRRLINIGKDKGYITYQELNDDLADDIVSSEEIDDLLQMFEDLNIKVISEPAGGQIEINRKTGETEEEDKKEKDSLYELEEDFSVKTYDPVKMYLKEMGYISLLSREGEVEIAKRIETNENQVINALFRCRAGLEYIKDLGRDLEAGTIKVRDVVNDIEDEYNVHQIGERRDFLLNLINKMSVLDLEICACWNELKCYHDAAQRKRLNAAINKTHQTIVEMMTSSKLEKGHIHKMVERYRETLKRLEDAEKTMVDCFLQAGGKPMSYMEKCMQELSASEEGGKRVKALNLPKEELTSLLAKLQKVKSCIDEIEGNATMRSKEFKKMAK